MTEKWKTEK